MIQQSRNDRRFGADFPEGTVIFLIGMRINSFRQVRRWMPLMRAMPKMLAELNEHPEFGLLGASSMWAGRIIMSVQYWRSMDHLMRYATGRDAAHLPAWNEFLKASKESNAVGVWHEAYEVHPERSHIVYHDMPEHGVGKATRFAPISELPPQAVRRQPVGDILTGA